MSRWRPVIVLPALTDQEHDERTDTHRYGDPEAQERADRVAEYGPRTETD